MSVRLCHHATSNCPICHICKPYANIRYQRTHPMVYYSVCTGCSKLFTHEGIDDDCPNCERKEMSVIIDGVEFVPKPKLRFKTSGRLTALKTTNDDFCACSECGSTRLTYHYADGCGHWMVIQCIDCGDLFQNRNDNGCN